MTAPEPNDPPAPPDGSAEVPTGDDFMATYFTADLMGTKNKGQDPRLGHYETRND